MAERVVVFIEQFALARSAEKHAAQDLSVRRAAGPVGRTREYDLASVSNVRAEPQGGADLAMAFRVPRAGGARGAIAFDHGAATVRVGPGLEGEDVTRLLEVLRERIPGRRAGF